MKILFFGSIIKNQDCTKYKGPSVAGNKMQVGLIKSLYNFYKSELTIFSEVPIASFPKENIKYIKKGNIELYPEIYAEKVPFLNFLFLKQLNLIGNSLSMIYNWAKKNKESEKVILCFNAFPVIAVPALIAKKFFKLKVVCILADPPIDAIERRGISKLAKKIESTLTELSIKKFDGLVVLNKETIVRYAPNSQHILVDGGFDMEDLPNNPVGGQWKKLEKSDTIKIVFSGALVEYNGIRNFVNSIEYIENQNISYEIYGSGPLDTFIKEAALKDQRIKYMGNIPNLEMVKVQQEAALLINPRPIDLPISKYTFPSKMIEYLLSGTPVVTTKLNGLTEEYLKHVYIFEKEKPRDIAITIENILKQDKNLLIEKAREARIFVARNKNWYVQSEKIKKFLVDL